MAGGLLAIPAISLFVFGVWAWFATDPHTPPELRSANVQTEGVVGLLQIGAYVLGKAMSALGSASRFVSEILMTLGIFAVAMSIALFLTGRGLHHHATWARIMGGLFSAGLLLASIAGVLAQHPIGSSASLVFLGGAVYALWVLGWRYS